MRNETVKRGNGNVQERQTLLDFFIMVTQGVVYFIEVLPAPSFTTYCGNRSALEHCTTLVSDRNVPFPRDYHL